MTIEIRTIEILIYVITKPQLVFLFTITVRINVPLRLFILGKKSTRTLLFGRILFSETSETK